MLHDQRQRDIRMGRRNPVNDLLITVTGEQGSGKTTVLRLIIDALADAGLLTVADTKFATEAPDQFFGYSRLDNLGGTESIEIDICPDSLLEHLKSPPVKKPPHLHYDCKIDPMLAKVMGTKQAVLHHVGRMLDLAEEKGLAVFPLTIDLDEYVIPTE